MEREQDFSQYIPFAKASLRETSEYFHKKTEKAGKYGASSRSKDLINSFFPGIIKNLEGFTGPLYSVESNLDDLIPEKWKSVFLYLRKKKIISKIELRPVYNDEPKMVRMSLRLSEYFDKNSTDGVFSEGIPAHGDSKNIDEALSKMLGEFLERYSLGIYKNKQLVKSSIRSLLRRKKRFIHPDSLSFFSQDQKKWFPRFGYDENTILNWTACQSLSSGKKLLIPSQLVFWDYNFSCDGYQEPILREANTNGASGYYTFVRAILGGLYELIQRDGFVIYWLNKLSPSRIDNDSIHDDKLRSLIQEFLDLELEVIFLDITTDLGVPSCVCVIVDQSGAGPKVSIGAGCGMDWIKILTASLIEASAVYNSLRMRKSNLATVPLVPDDSYRPFQELWVKRGERLDMWCEESMFDKIQFFISGEKIQLETLIKKEKKFPSPKSELIYLIKKFKSFNNKDYEIYYYRAKNHILDNLEYSVVKVIVPALVPLYLHEIYVPLGAKRLKEVPARIGYLSPEEFNVWPHPFP